MKLDENRLCTCKTKANCIPWYPVLLQPSSCWGKCQAQSSSQPEFVSELSNQDIAQFPQHMSLLSAPVVNWLAFPDLPFSILFSSRALFSSIELNGLDSDGALLSARSREITWEIAGCSFAASWLHQTYTWILGFSWARFQTAPAQLESKSSALDFHIGYRETTSHLYWYVRSCSHQTTSKDNCKFHLFHVEWGGFHDYLLVYI